MSIENQLKGIITADELQYTQDRLKAVVDSFLEADVAVEAAYKNRAELMERKTRLDTEIKLDEADALMRIEGEGKTAYAMIGDKKIVLSNDQVRDAYRRTYTKDKRTELAQIEAQLARIEIEIMKAKDKYKTAADAAATLQAVAAVQAAALNTLAKVAGNGQ
ncbi:MAG TPA: hypothetical protein VN258_07555 [Mobilitalea sp.]|nr:hypothetical protein [Mobilitalea sp.]